MSSKICPKIILEGTRLTFKTEIAFALNEHPRIVGPRKYRYHSPLISAKWCGVSSFCATTHGSLTAFIISTRAYQLRTYGVDHDLGWLEERLAALGSHHPVLHTDGSVV